MQGTPKTRIVEWIDEGVEQGATHLIVVCDEWEDWTDYPVYVMPGEDARKIAEENGYPETKNMCRVVEVYNLQKNLQEQLAEYRAFWF